MNELKIDISAFVAKVAGKGYDWLSRLLNQTDHTITKVMDYMQEKRFALDQYDTDRKVLISAIEHAKQEVDYYRTQLDRVKQSQSEQIINLHERLEERTENLLRYQKEYNALENKVEKSITVLSHLSHEKELVVNERNHLKSEYDHLQQIIQRKMDELGILREEVNVLTTRSMQNAAGDIAEKESQLQNLEQSYQETVASQKELQQQLVQKMKETAQLSGQMQKTETEKESLLEETGHLRQLIETNETARVEERQQLTIVKNKAAAMKEELRKHAELAAGAKEREQKLQLQLTHLESDYQAYSEVADTELQELKLQLQIEQNNTAIAKAENEDNIHLSKEGLEILQQEYEPRFKTLYKESIIGKELFKDFYQLTPKDRLQVEAAIVNLNLNSERAKSKIRSNPIDTGNTSPIYEYTFGQDSAGRIYFRKKDGSVHFYRISRSKNGGKRGQERVIASLKRKKV